MKVLRGQRRDNSRRIDTLPAVPQNAAMSGRITPAQFVEKWSRVTLSERAASQGRFIDLCRRECSGPQSLKPTPAPECIIEAVAPDTPGARDLNFNSACSAARAMSVRRRFGVFLWSSRRVAQAVTAS